MEQLLVKSGYDIFQFIQIGIAGRCHIILWR